ncbi:HAD family hydrolase, partial [Singulisphaera rosea]
SAFDAIVGKEDVVRVKPDPECYLLALERVGVSAAEAVAIEDSPMGLTAAKAAMLGTIAVGHRLPRGDWSGDSHYVDGLARYADVLKALELA